MVRLQTKKQESVSGTGEPLTKLACLAISHSPRGLTLWVPEGWSLVPWAAQVQEREPGTALWLTWALGALGQEQGL